MTTSPSTLNTAADPLIVAVGVLIEDQRVLLAQRRGDVHLARLWEFPGGKAEPGESIAEALRREFLEELDIQVLVSEPLMDLAHNYPEKSVLLRVHRVTHYRGDAHGREGQAVGWFRLEQLNELAFPDANWPILDYVRRELASSK